MNLSKNTIALRKGLVIPPNDLNNNKIETATLNQRLQQFGYMLTEKAFDAVSKAHLSWIQDFYTEIENYLEKELGGGARYEALYKNFPEEVMSLTDTELYHNALRHYWSNGHWEPTPKKQFDKPFAFEIIDYKFLEAGTEDNFDGIFTALTRVNQSIHPSDVKIIKWFGTSGRTLKYPEQIPFKENLCLLAGMGLPGLPVKTTTDVLRIAVSMSGGNISLPAIPPKMIKQGRWSSKLVPNPERDAYKFRKFKRSERRYILSLLENSNCDTREMFLRQGSWVRLGEILHPGEYQSRFPKAAKAFDTIRNAKKKTWYGEVASAFTINFQNGLKKLSERPGEFARRIDALVRKNVSEIPTIVNLFGKATLGTSNKVLFEVYSHFENRKSPKVRSVKVKGHRKTTMLPTLPALDEQVISDIQSHIFSTLEQKFSTLEPMGDVYIDPELKLIPMPTDMRSMSESSRPIIRGQAVPFTNPDTKVFRPFVHWHDLHGNEDIDLSATFVGKKTKTVLSFQNPRVAESYHSGDVRRRRGYCAEYIDINIQDALSQGFEYVVVDVRNYQGGSMASIESKFGFMEREYPESNNHWLPETVANTFKFNSQSSNVIAVIIDLINKTYIIVDEDSSGSVVASQDIKTILAAVEKWARPPKISVYDLITMHVNARGGRAVDDTAANIDTYFKAEDFKFSYEKTLELMGV